MYTTISKKIYFLAILIIIASCENNEKTFDEDSVIIQKGKSDEYQLQVIDTLKFNIVSPITVLGDFIDSTFAFFDPITKDIFICNKTGDIINQFNQSGFHDEGFGNNLTSILLKNDSVLFVMSEIGIYEYNYLEGSLINFFKHEKRVKGLVENGIIISGQSILAPVFKDDTQEITGLVTPLDFTTDLPVFEKDFYELAKHLRYIDFTNDTSYTAFLPYPSNSLYKNAEGYYHLNTAMIASEKRSLVAMFGLDPKVYLFDFDQGFNFFKKLQLDLNFDVLEPNPFGKGNSDFYKGLMSDRFTNLILDKSHIYIGYKKWTPQKSDISSKDLESDRRAYYRNTTDFIQIVDLETNEYFMIETPKQFPYLKKFKDGMFYLLEEVYFHDEEPKTLNILVTKLTNK